jgi:hypothetical protein
LLSRIQRGCAAFNSQMRLSEGYRSNWSLNNDILSEAPYLGSFMQRFVGGLCVSVTEALSLVASFNYYTQKGAMFLVLRINPWVLLPV